MHADFEEVLPVVRRVIAESLFIALDTEFTGFFFPLFFFKPLFVLTPCGRSDDRWTCVLPRQ